jgi:hypothetical protein
VRLQPVTDLKVTIVMPGDPAGWGASRVSLPSPPTMMLRCVRSDLSRATAELSWTLVPITRKAKKRDGRAASARSPKRSRHSPSGLLFPDKWEPAAATRAVSGSASVSASQIVIGRPPVASPPPAPPAALVPIESPRMSMLHTPCGALPGTFAIEDNAAAGPFGKLLTTTFPTPVDVYISLWRCPTHKPLASDFQWVAWGVCSLDGLAFSVPSHMRASGALFTCAVYHGDPGRTTGVSPDNRSPLALELFTCHAPAHMPLVSPADEPLQLDNSTLRIESGVARIHRVNGAGGDLCVKEFLAESMPLARLQQAAVAEYKTQSAVTSNFICRAVRVTLDPPQLVSEWVAGGTLTSALRPKACPSHYPRATPESCAFCAPVRTPWDRSLMLHDVAEGLAALHRVGVSGLPAGPSCLSSLTA